MSATDVILVNAALTRCGLERISSLEDVNTRAQVALANYEVLVTGELAKHRWRWATKTAILSQHVDPAPDPWLYAYQLPVEARTLATVMQAGDPIEYAQMGTAILTLDDNSEYEIVAHYGWRPPEAQWPGWWSEPFVQRLEAVFLRAFGERHAEAQQRDKWAENGFVTARRLDSQNQSPIDPYSYPILAARRG